jgi:hypothetical protein
MSNTIRSVGHPPSSHGINIDNKLVFELLTTIMTCPRNISKGIFYVALF